MGAMMAFMVDFGINIHILWVFLELYARSSLGLWVPVLTEGPKGLSKGPCTPEGPLRTLSEANTGNPNDGWAVLDQAKKTRSLLDLKYKFGDLKTIFHWRSPTIHRDSETAVCRPWQTFVFLCVLLKYQYLTKIWRQYYCPPICKGHGKKSYNLPSGMLESK